MKDELFQILHNPNGGDTLSAQKETSKTYTNSQITAMGFVVLFSVILLIISVATNEPVQGWAIRFGALPIMLLMLIIIGLTYCKRRRYDQILQGIEFSATETKTVTCENLRFLRHRVSKYNTKLAGILLCDEVGEWYFYIFPEMVEGNIGIGRNPYRAMREMLLHQSITVCCYQGTNAVQSIR